MSKSKHESSRTNSCGGKKRGEKAGRLDNKWRMCNCNNWPAKAMCRGFQHSAAAASLPAAETLWRKGFSQQQQRQPLFQLLKPSGGRVGGVSASLPAGVDRNLDETVFTRLLGLLEFVSLVKLWPSLMIVTAVIIAILFYTTLPLYMYKIFFCYRPWGGGHPDQWPQPNGKIFDQIIPFTFAQPLPCVKLSHISTAPCPILIISEVGIDF